MPALNSGFTQAGV